MKNFTTFIISLLSVAGMAQWVELDPGVNVSSFSDVYAITPDTVIVTGPNGIILKTTDGGETWQQKPSGTTQGLGKVQFPTPEIGYVIGGGGVLLKTIDGGETWNGINTGQNASFGALSCVDENVIFIAFGNYLLVSEDGGDIWSSYSTGINNYGRNFQFFNREIGYIPNEGGGISKTEDGGETWQQITGLSPFHFLNENIGFYYEGGLVKIIDGGNNVQYLGYGTGEYLSSIFAINENIVWGIFEPLLDWDGTTRGIIKISSDETYTEVIEYDNSSSIDMTSIHFANETTGYIVGYKNNKGTIWKNGTGINVLDTKENNLKDNIKIYPNPASKEINIVVNNLVNRTFNVVITDITGRQVYSQFFNENKVKINTERFSKGIYILSVESNNKFHFQKIIIH